MIIWMVVAVFAVLTLCVAWSIEDWSRDLTTNTAKLDESHADQSLRPLTLAMTPTEVVDHLQSWTREHGAWEMVSTSDQDGGVDVHLIHRSRLLRFADDVHVDLRSTDDGVRINAESKSRIGKGDFGQNPRNLRELVGAMKGFAKAT